MRIMEKLQLTWQQVALAVTAGAIGVYVLYTVFSSGVKQILSPATKTIYRRFKLVKRANISHDTRLFRFALPDTQAVLGLPIGQHIILRFVNDSGEDVERAYTPVSSDDNVGYFELVIKVYDKGQMTQHLEALSEGDFIYARGPEGRIKYVSPGNFEIKRRMSKPAESVAVTRIAMIAGGTGITPMLQIIRHVAKDETDKTEIRLIFGNQAPNDILLRKELDEVEQKFDFFSVHYTVDRDAPKDWKGSVGYVTKEMIGQTFWEPSDDVIVINCGPPIMQRLCVKALKEMGYKNVEAY